MALFRVYKVYSIGLIRCIYRGYIGDILGIDGGYEVSMGLCREYIGMMEKKMETTIRVYKILVVSIGRS